MTNPRRVRGAENFDRVASLYAFMEQVTFGRALWRTRVEFLPLLGASRKALVLGDGDGRFLAALLDTNPAVRVESVDSSGAMLRLQHRRTGRSGRVEYHQADAREFTPRAGEAYDLVVTHFFLDCLSRAELDSLIARIAARTAPGSWWLVSEFAIPAGKFAGSLARLIIRALYAAFRLLTGLRATSLPDHAAALRSAGYTLQAERTRLGGLLTSQLWQRKS